MSSLMVHIRTHTHLHSRYVQRQKILLFFRWIYMVVKYRANDESFWIPSHRNLQSNLTYSLESRPIQLAPHRATPRLPLFWSSPQITSKEMNNRNTFSLEKKLFNARLASSISANRKPFNLFCPTPMTHLLCARTNVCHCWQWNWTIR